MVLPDIQYINDKLESMNETQRALCWGESKSFIIFLIVFETFVYVSLNR